MEFRIADTFTASLDRLTADEQRAAKTCGGSLFRAVCLPR